MFVSIILVKIESKKEGKIEIKPIKAEPADEVDIKPVELTSSIGMQMFHTLLIFATIIFVYY